MEYVEMLNEFIKNSISGKVSQYPPSSGSLLKIKAFIETNDERVLDGCTFYYIMLYCRYRVSHTRLVVGCFDFGFTVEELDGHIREHGDCAMLVARKVIQKYHSVETEEDDI